MRTKKLIKSLNISLLLTLLFSKLAAANCFLYAEKVYGIDARLLTAIAKIESGMNPAAIGKNKNGTYDIGLMQINSSHIPKLKKIGINEAMLKTDPCISVLVGASILADMFRVYGYSWEAIGAYNAGLKKENYALRMRYAKKVWRIYQQS